MSFSSLKERYLDSLQKYSDIHEYLTTLLKFGEKVNHITEFGVRAGISTCAFLNSKPKIQRVVESLKIDAHYIYLVQDEHYQTYNLKYLLNLITPNCEIIRVKNVTDGAARTCLLAADVIDNEKELIIANSDQIIEWNPHRFFYYLDSKNADGGILTFESSHPKWSYAKTDESNQVIEVAEKAPISNKATTGIYWFKTGKSFVKAASNMISKNIRVNNEFYVCPVFNELILSGKAIYTFDCEKMNGVGTPEDLNEYLRTT